MDPAGVLALQGEDWRSLTQSVRRDAPWGPLTTDAGLSASPTDTPAHAGTM